MVVVVVVAGAGLPLAIACVGENPDIDATPDGSIDGTVGSDGSPDGTSQGDAATDAGNLLLNGDFSAACAAWTNNESMSSPDPNNTRTPGSMSCRVCATVDAGVYNIFQTVAITSAPGERLTAEAYVREAPGNVSDTPMETQISNQDSNDALLEETYIPGAPPFGTEWKRIGGTLLVSDGGAKVTVAFGSSVAGSGTCFLIDDAVLRKGP
jgi:hypothetical protein